MEYALQFSGLEWIPAQGRDDEGGDEGAWQATFASWPTRKHGTLYVGVTSDLSQRVHEHKTHATPGFTSKCGYTRLVWYEEHFDIRDAITREKSIKRWRREWKIELIEAMNPGWNELYAGMGW